MDIEDCIHYTHFFWQVVITSRLGPNIFTPKHAFELNRKVIVDHMEVDLFGGDDKQCSICEGMSGGIFTISACAHVANDIISVCGKCVAALFKIGNDVDARREYVISKNRH